MAGGNAKATLAAVVASMGAFLFGLDIGYIAPILRCESFKRDVAHLVDWKDPDSSINGAAAGFIVGIFSLGCIITAVPVVSSYFLDTWGRRNSVILGSLVFLAGCILQAESNDMMMFYVGRLVTGGAIGLLSSVVPLYQAEMAPASIRGALTGMYQLMLTLGIFVAALVDTFLVGHDGGWRVAIWLQMIPAGFILLSMPFLPRSPRWLVSVGRTSEAEQTLLAIRPESEARREFREIMAEDAQAKAIGEPRWIEVFTGRVGRLCLVGIALQMLQQLVGMNAFMYFGPRIFGSVGLKENLFQTINNAVNCVATLPALYLADRSGRRPLLLVGGITMTATCAGMGIFGLGFMTRGKGDSYEPHNDWVGGVLAACVFAFVAAFACSWGPMVWCYCCEIFPLKYRGRCVGVTTMTNWVGNYIIAQFTPVLLDAIGFGTFFVFGAFCLLGTGLAIWLPETKGVALEHVGELFDEKFGEAAGQSMVAGKGAATYGATITNGKVDA